jgi:hypothetical protein
MLGLSNNHVGIQFLRLGASDQMKDLMVQAVVDARFSLPAADEENPEQGERRRFAPA